MENKDFTVVLGQYKGLHYKKPMPGVTEEEVEAALEQERMKCAKPVTVGKAAELGDTVVIDYAGFCGDEQFEGGTSSEPYPLELGSNSFIPGFEEQLVGASAGEDRDVNVTFPEQYHAPNLAGKAAVFKCKVHEVQQKQIPALGDAFAKDNYGIETLAELRTAIEQNIAAQKQAQELNRIIGMLLNEIVSTSSVKISEEYRKASIDQMVQYFASQLQQQGASIQMYCQYNGISEEELHTQLAAQADLNASNVAVLAAIAEEEKLEVTDADVDAELEKMAAQYGMPAAQLKSMIPAEQIEEMKNGLRTTKAVDFIMKNAVAEE